jgi:hypothetical protein
MDFFALSQHNLSETVSFFTRIKKTDHNQTSHLQTPNISSYHINAIKHINTGRFIMFSVITHVYNKKTKGSTLMELFKATGKLKKVFFYN